MKNIKKYLVFILPIFFSFFFLQNVHADAIDVVKVRGLYNCFSNGTMKSTIPDISSGLKLGDLFNNDKQDNILLPSGQYQHQIEDGNIECAEAIFGFDGLGGKITGLIPRDNLIGNPDDVTVSSAEAKEILKKLGYESGNPAGKDGKTRKCKYFNYNEYNYDTPDGTTGLPVVVTDKVCVVVDANDKIVDSGKTEIVYDKGIGNHIPALTFEFDGSSVKFYCNNKLGNDGATAVNKGMTSESFFQNLHNDMSNNGCQSISYLPPGQTSQATMKVYKMLGYESTIEGTGGAGDEDGNDTEWHFKNNSWLDAANAAITANSGDKNWTKLGDVLFSEEEKTLMHQYYFAQYYKAKIYCDGDDKSSIEQSYLDKRVDLPQIKSKQNCFAIPYENADEKVRGVILPNMTWFKEYTFEELVKTLDEEQLFNADSATSSATPQDSGTQTDAETDPCASADLFGMGWLLCSSLKNGTRTLDPLEGMIQQMLAVNPTLYGMYYKGTTNETATYKAWKIIRGVANFIMIVIFLVVIFSQITGHGIDNYGIKKILPKLILGAILINLSFIICELIVDLSNILGQGLDSLFYNIAQGIQSSSGSQYNALSDWSMTAIVDTFLAGLGLAGAGAGVAGLVLDFVGIESGGTLVIIMLLAVAVILISLLIFFASLGARMIIIIVCVTISPVAFAFYILPNTQKLFQKWWKLFESALIIYPICGALYGISQLIRVIIFSTGGEIFIWEGVIAVIAPYVPFFAIPLLLKSAISALGVAGAALTSIGSGLRNSTSKAVSAIQNSEGYKDRINMAADEHNERALARSMQRLKSRQDNGKSTKGAEREVARLAKRRLQFDKDNFSRGTLTDPSRLAAARAGIKNQALESEIQGYMTQIGNDDFRDATKDHNIVDGSSVNSVRDALMAEMARPAEEQNYAKQAALLRTLESKGKAGLGAMGEILDSPIAYSDANRQIIGDMVNNGTLKDQYKSAHEVARSIQSNMQTAYTEAAKNGTNASQEYAQSSTAGQAGMVRARLDSGDDNGKIKPQDLPNLHDEQLKSFVTTSAHDPSANETLNKALESPDVNFNSEQLHTIYDGQANNIADHIDELYNASPSTQIESTTAIDAANLISSKSNPYINEATTDKVVNSLQNYQNRKGGASIKNELIAGGWAKGVEAHTLTNGSNYIYHTDTGRFEKRTT